MKETIVLGIRYTGQEMKDYYKVKQLADKNRQPLSTTGKLLINRGLTHSDNPEPLVKTVKEVVEKIVPKDRYPYCTDCPGKPNVDKSTSHIEEHITEEHIGGDHKTGQHLSGDTLMTRDKADPPNNIALGLKKSPKKDNPDKGSNLGGWIALGGILTLIFGPVVYSWLTKG